VAIDRLSQNIRNLNLEKVKAALVNLSPMGLTWTLVASFLLATSSSIFLALILMRRSEPQQDLPGSFGAEIGGAGAMTPTSLSPTEVERIVKRNIFNSEGKVGDDSSAEAEEEVAQGGDTKAVKTDLPLKLIGIIFGGTPFNGLAMVENTTKRVVSSFIVGDTLVKGAKLAEVYTSRVIIERGGRREFLELETTELVRDSREKGRKKAPAAGGKADDFAPIAAGPAPENFKEDGFERAGANIQITSAWRDNMLTSDFAKVLQDAKAEPNVVDGEVKGFRLTRVRENSVYLKAGIQNGDIIEEINGVPLKDAANAIRLLQQLRSADDIDVRVKSGESSKTMNIKIK